MRDTSHIADLRRQHNALVKRAQARYLDGDDAHGDALTRQADAAEAALYRAIGPKPEQDRRALRPQARVGVGDYFDEDDFYPWRFE